MDQHLDALLRNALGGSYQLPNSVDSIYLGINIAFHQSTETLS